MSWIEHETKKMFAKMKEFKHPDDISYNLIQQNFCEKLNKNRPDTKLTFSNNSNQIDKNGTS